MRFAHYLRFERIHLKIFFRDYFQRNVSLEDRRNLKNEEENFNFNDWINGSRFCRL
jgi:hypothetical protein